MNEYTKDGVAFIRRASEKNLDDILVDPMELNEAVLLFAMGIEKLLKGILWEINPLLIYEDMSLKNICLTVYNHKLTDWARNRLTPKNQNAEQPDNKVHTGNATLAAAANFSKTADKRGPTLRELFRLRGIIAHRAKDEFNYRESLRFLKKHFYPLVSELAFEMKIDDMSQFFAHGAEEKLKNIAAAIVENDKVAEQCEQLKKQHLEVWYGRKDDQIVVKKTQAAMSLDLDCLALGSKSFDVVACPFCGQNAILIISMVEVPDGDRTVEERFVTGLKCHFCDASITDPDMVEELQLQMLL